jgi:hypothetical protein
VIVDGPVITLILAGIGGVVWLVRLEGRINGHDTEFRQMREDVTYIRQRIDKAIEGD